MFSGGIDDSALSASSSFNHKNVGPHNARLVSANRTNPSISCPNPHTGGADAGVVELTVIESFTKRRLFCVINCVKFAILEAHS